MEDRLGRRLPPRLRRQSHPPPLQAHRPSPLNLLRKRQPRPPQQPLLPLRRHRPRQRPQLPRNRSRRLLPRYLQRLRYPPHLKLPGRPRHLRPDPRQREIRLARSPSLPQPPPLQPNPQIRRPRPKSPHPRQYRLIQPSRVGLPPMRHLQTLSQALRARLIEVCKSPTGEVHALADALQASR